MNCELSIIVPVYNTAQYLPQCIESILKQSFKNWELILIDDGSTDSSAEICEEWAQKDARIKVIHKVNSGQADCRNQALEICQGTYIGFVDSDDWIDESMYEVLMDDLKTTNSDIAICNHYEESKNKTLCKNASDKRYILKNQEIQELVIKDKIKSYIWQMLFKRELLNEPMPTSKNYEDYSILPHWFVKRFLLRNIPTGSVQRKTGVGKASSLFSIIRMPITTAGGISGDGTIRLME